MLIKTHSVNIKILEELFVYAGDINIEKITIKNMKHKNIKTIKRSYTFPSSRDLPSNYVKIIKNYEHFIYLCIFICKLNTVEIISIILYIFHSMFQSSVQQCLRHLANFWLIYINVDLKRHEITPLFPKRLARCNSKCGTTQFV